MSLTIPGRRPEDLLALSLSQGWDELPNHIFATSVAAPAVVAGAHSAVPISGGKVTGTTAGRNVLAASGRSHNPQLELSGSMWSAVDGQLFGDE